MQNSPTTIPAPPPLPLPPPPHSPGQITVLIAPQPPPPSAGAPSSVFQITVLPAPPAPPLPPFPDAESSVDLSPLKFLLALVAIVAIPALIYTFIFSFRWGSSRRREPSGGEFSGDSSVASEISHREVEVPGAGAGAGASDVSDVKYRKETHSREIGDECPVCLSAFAEGGQVRKLSACKHAFHADCIDKWLSNHNNCPNCRAPVAAASLPRSNSSAPSRDGEVRRGHRDAAALV